MYSHPDRVIDGIGYVSGGPAEHVLRCLSQMLPHPGQPVLLAQSTQTWGQTLRLAPPIAEEIVLPAAILSSALRCARESLIERRR